MEGNNICKFNINRSSDLVCHNFVLETGTAHANISQNNFYILGLVTSGTGILSQCGRTCDLQKEMLFAVLRDQPFCICGDGELQYCYIGFSGRRAEELVERVGILSQEFAPQLLPSETVGFCFAKDFILACQSQASNPIDGIIEYREISYFKS